MRKFAWVTLAIAFLPSSLAAQNLPRCPDTLTIARCKDVKLRAAADSLNVADLNVAEEKELIQKTTGVTTPAEDEGESIGDFLSKLSTALVAPGLDDSFDQLGTSFNFPLGTSLSIKLGLTLKKPVVYQVLLDSLRESRREAFKERVEGDFGELDQPLFTALFNPETRSWGRRYQKHADDFSAVLNELRAQSKLEVKDSGFTLTAFNGLTAKARDRRIAIPECPNTQTPSNLALGCIEGNFRDSLETFLDTMMHIRVRQEAWLEAELDRTGFSMLADLVNNQPQLTFSASYDALSRAVGPTGLTLKVRAETGFANMNKLRKACAQKVAAECMRVYFARDDVKRALRGGNRMWASFDYTFQDDYTAPYLPIDSAQFAMPSAWDFNLTAGYGAYVNPRSDGAQESRIDALLKYTGRKEDGVREPSQLSFTLNVTQKISEKFAGSFGLVWANKSELIGDDFRKVGARLGLKFKLAEPDQQ